MQMKLGKLTWWLLLMACFFVLSTASCQGNDGDKIIRSEPNEKDGDDGPPN